MQPDDAARLRETATSTPDTIAIVQGDDRVTYGELNRKIDGATAWLQTTKGLAPGDRVVLLVGNRPAFVEAWLATLRAGAVAVPLLPGLAPDEIAHVVADARPALAIVAEEHVDDLPHDLARAVVGGDPDEWRAAVEHEATPELPPRADTDIAALVYTSGTTGRPKGAILTRGNLRAGQDQALAGRFRVNGQDRVLLALPLAHIYALNVGLGACMRVGATMVLEERFDPAATIQTMTRERVTIVLGAPPMYLSWLATPGIEDADLSSLRLAVSGAAPLPVTAIERFRTITGLTIEEGYGLTEASPSVTSNAMADASRPGSVGKPVPDLELKLVDDQGNEPVQGDPGEVWVRGPNVFQGYWEDAEATAEALTDDGWLRTGDVGTFDADGYLFLVDRLKDLIIVSGFNVYPREVERVLVGHDGVHEAAVVGVPHPYRGESVMAYVVARPGSTLDADTLDDHCRRHLARYKCPERIRVVDELPHTATGKVRRSTLRDAG